LILNHVFELISGTIFFTFVLNNLNLERGLVLKSTGSNYKVLDANGFILDCSVKGKLRIKELRITNPIAVGDNVLFTRDPNSNSTIIYEVLDRHNYILRKASNLSKHSQIIAANIDQVLLMITIVLPTHAGLILKDLTNTVINPGV